MREKADIYFTYRVIRENNVPQEIEFFIHKNNAVIEKIERSREGVLPEPIRENHTERKKDTGQDDGKSPASPDVEARTLFLKDRTQAELQDLGTDQVEGLREEARKHVERNEPDASGIYRESMVASRMEKLWGKE